jgi:hypothetical protein
MRARTLRLLGAEATATATASDEAPLLCSRSRSRSRNAVAKSTNTSGSLHIASETIYETQKAVRNIFDGLECF